MADYFVQEGGTGNFISEDGSGELLLEGAFIYTKTGVGVVPFTGSGAKAFTPEGFTYAKAGVGISVFSGRGAEAFTDGSTGGGEDDSIPPGLGENAFAHVVLVTTRT